MARTGTRARRGGQGGQLEWTTIELSTGLREIAQCLEKAQTRAIKDLLRHGYLNIVRQDWDACPPTKFISNNYDLCGQVSKFNVNLP